MILTIDLGLSPDQAAQLHQLSRDRGVTIEALLLESLTNLLAEAKIKGLRRVKLRAAGKMADQIQHTNPTAELEELGAAWAEVREMFRLISKPYPLAANEKLPTETEYRAATERAYEAIDRAVEFARSQFQPGNTYKS